MLPEGARILPTAPICDHCGTPGLIDAPLYGAPPGLGYDGKMLCEDCTATMAVSILGGSGSRAQRRRQEFARKHKKQHHKKRSRR